jgi:hypothetical protein
MSWGLCTGGKCEKVVLLEFSTGTNNEKLKFLFVKFSKFTFRTGTKSEKVTLFSLIVPVQRLQDIKI